MQFTRVLFIGVISFFSVATFAQNYNLDVQNYLTDGFVKEHIEVHIDGKLAGTMDLTTKNPSSSIRLTLDKPTHSYAISGEGVNAEGNSVAYSGQGLIATSHYVDSLLEKQKNGAEVVAGYQRLLNEINVAAPNVDTSDLKLQVGSKASAKSLALAEKRLKLELPTDYKTLVQEVGSLLIGTEDKSVVYGPDELISVVEYYSKEVGLTEEQRQQIIKRYRKSSRDIVLDYFYLDEYSVLQARPKCPKGQYGFMFPGYDMGLIATASMIDDNPFFALVDYEDDIMGEPECTNYTTVLGWGLIDFLAYNADYVFFIATGSDDDGVEGVTLSVDSFRSTEANYIIKFED